MTRYLTLAFLVSAAVASAEESAATRPRCDRNGGTILVFHDYVGCGMNGDPNEIDPWHFNGVAAEPSGGAAIYSLDWRVGATADFNGDGVCDVAWSLGEDAGQDVTVDLSLSVDGEFQGPNGTGSQLMGPWRVVGAADYLGHPAPDGTPTTADGSADLVLWNRVTGQLGVWVGDGSGGLLGSPYVVDGRELPWEPRVIANLDGKNFSEIVWEQPLTGQLAYTRLMWQNAALVHTAGEPLDPEAPLAGGWVIRAADDFNGDGYEDLVFQHTGSQKAVVWFMKGRQRIGGVFMQPDRLIPPCGAAAFPMARYDIVGPR